MAKCDLASNLFSYVTVAPQLLNATTAGTAVDTKGFESVTLLLSSGAYQNGTQTWKLQESDTTTDGDFADVDTTLLINNANFPGAIAANTSENKVFWLGYAGSKRYVRAKMTANVIAANGAIYGAAILLGDPHSAPTQ
jgi:hypothetical protein